MALKDELYAINRGNTLADNIDRAWAIYVDEAHQLECDRETAQEFLIYAFDLKSIANLNEQLLALMAERNLHKMANPEYIPRLTPKQLQLDPTELTLRATVASKSSPDIKLQSLFDRQEILDVTDVDKVRDMTASTRYFSRQQRANQRIHLYQGKFYQQGKLFSTANYESHKKSGYASFTLNANGELSVFKHFGMRDKIAHSSMNAGSPVVCAGEIAIRNGALVALTTHSGHYQPSLFNIYRALDYFVDKGVNIRNAHVYTFYNPDIYGLDQLNAKRTYIDSQFKYSIPAHAVFHSFKSELHHSLLTIQSDTKKYQESILRTIFYAFKDWVIGSTLTRERKSIAIEVATTATALFNELADDAVDNHQRLEGLIVRLDTLRDDNNELSVSHGKRQNSGRLGRTIDSFIQQARAIQHLAPTPEIMVDTMKLAH